MPILVRKNIRAIGSNDLLGPPLQVDSINLVSYTRSSGEKVEFELFNLEDGSRKKAQELLFLEIDDDLLVAMRLDAAIRAKGGESKKARK